MSAKSVDIESKLTTVLNEPWNITDGIVVPKTEDVVEKNGGRRLEATYLYADMADSTLLAKSFKDLFSARVFRMYVKSAVECIRYKDGHIRSFDGDRVMGIFIGSRRSNNAVEAALAINWAVDQVINPKLKARLEPQDLSWSVSHRVGIDDGETLIVRGGARDNSDLISIGRAPNIAAKLSGIRNESGQITVTSAVYERLEKKNQFKGGDGEAMWAELKSRTVGPYSISTRNCGWYREP
ncbi:family 3 adenylate cyclase [Mycobacteroides abscessus subsp. abscessus]|uniref:adenylate/guanylate cyclase domain-containing protein n=1 Tax=Mycobacteroides abscessus TaxID=36809 RepID=UPI000925F631|nr:adenylate/guanylate cyclase domain-containing protein [Mycobacteroides abscessus]SHX10920.1 family 3 adenylate cyclase [Mycobacteroides abscessus subsp. abscessus]SHX59409.1 family 3 adenylate cyclase [Mycobacteroides abscessus subsp. abscessus]SIC05497.1 family 3 adenylate cyclase [Mycobacteroides abscessus subsp. abscessus]SKV96660.1 family 3 adenylate cyclase [Mycobacteroides abscessus subsp. abscessus]